MERKKIDIEDIPILEREVLKLCLFTESFEQICQECEWTKDRNIVADAVKNLIHKKLLKAENIDRSLAWIYDSDNMSESKFKATAAGIEMITSLV